MATATLELRSQVAELTADAAEDLTVVLSRFDSAATASPALHDLLPVVVGTYGPAAASTAAIWYDTLRDSEGVPGRFDAIPADIPNSGEHALIGWALDEANEYPAFQSLILGGTQRRIANYARQTVTQSSIADPRARGWQRTGSGNCDFCSMLIGRGAVYTEASVDFPAHDHCNCGAEPAF